jgi:hypothetical protein
MAPVGSATPLAATASVLMRTNARYEEIRVTNVVLEPGDSLGIMFHPTERSGTVLVDAAVREDIQVCAADQFEAARSADQSSWGSRWHGSVCRRLNARGRASLPRYSEHVSIAIRNAGGSAHELDAVKLRYSNHDRYNVVRLPFLAVGARPRVFIPTYLGESAVIVSASWQPGTRAELHVSSAHGSMGDVHGDGEAMYFLSTSGLSKRALRRISATVEAMPDNPIQPTISFSTG